MELKSYIKNRKQYVEISDSNSDILTVTTGVPKGSIICPLLFIIYINDIAHASNLFNFIIYVDDTTLSTTLEIILKNKPNLNIDTTLNSELEKITDWLKVNKLSLNIAKCKYVIFHMPQKKVKPLQLLIENTTVEKAQEFNFLVLTLNEHINWKSHINNLLNKISRNIDISNKLLIYNSLILSHLNFEILPWGYQCERINKLQKKTIRIISISKHNAHTELLFKELKVLKVTDIIILQELKFYCKYKNNKFPHYLQNLPLECNIDIHSYETRTQHKLRELKTDHEYAKKCLHYDVIKIINNTQH